MHSPQTDKTEEFRRLSNKSGMVTKAYIIPAIWEAETCLKIQGFVWAEKEVQGQKYSLI